MLNASRCQALSEALETTMQGLDRMKATESIVGISERSKKC